MARLCMRTGCDHLAEAQLSYDPVNCHAWLDPLPTEPELGQELCELHAANLRVPQGWDSVDRRHVAPSPTPVASDDPVPVTEPVAEPLPAAKPQAEPQAEAEPVVDPVAEPTRVSEPKPTRVKAKSRPKPSLLSRALKTTGPQRSALSEELGAPTSTDTSSTDTSSTDTSSTN